jgi:hypothetical protein
MWFGNCQAKIPCDQFFGEAKMLLESSPDYQRNNPLVTYIKQFGIALLLSAAAWISTGCSGVSFAAPTQSSVLKQAVRLPPTNASSSIKLTVSPALATVVSGAQQQFVATLTSTSNTKVVWSASAGTITNTGLFTAPSVTSATAVRVIATNTAILPAAVTGTMPLGGESNITSDTTGSISGGADVTVVPVSKLSLSNSPLPEGTSGTAYSATLTATGGVTPYQWQIAAGALPQGLSLAKTSGVISGIPIQTGSFTFTATVTDASSSSASGTLSVTIGSSTAANYDGPAELPRVYIQSSLADTPAPGTVTLVPKGGNLQAALNSANCGDTIQLQAGATFTGLFTFPAKSCNDSNWIIVRTSAPDSALPPEGTRLTPCYAGVSSLPGRPPFNCTSTTNVTAKLVMSAVEESGPIVFASGANHYRLLGLEVTRQQGAPLVTSLVSIQPQGTMDNIVFDRVWMHGTAQDETTRGVELVGGTYVAIVDSFFTDFHCVARTGACTDAQAILGGLGSNPMGPYQILDNFLEASGENILFGGGRATISPADIEIRGNHMFKPLTWMKGQPGYVGGADGNPFVVKNLFELKNAQRVLLDGNIMEDTWGGFSQAGFGILLTPRNQPDRSGGNLCPECQVTDVTIRYTIISHVGAGLQIANPTDHDAAALAGERYSIHDIIIDDIDGAKYNGPSLFAQISVAPGAPLLQDVTINHVTAFPGSILFVIGDQTSITTKMKNFVFMNSIVNAGTYPVWSTGNGGSADCAAHDSPLYTFNACFSPYIFASNAIISAPKHFPAPAWPGGNAFPASTSAVQFVNYNNGNAGNYQLQSSSPYLHAATDGTSLGADVNAVMSATAGVN